MKRRANGYGFSLIELMIGMTASTILVSSAVVYFVAQSSLLRASAIKNDVADRGRAVRDIITNDIMRAGGYWSNEMGADTAAPRGAFGMACRGGTLVNWPQYPISGVNNNAAPDLIYLIVPSGMAVPGNARPTRAAYQAKAVGGTIQLMDPAGYAALPDGWVLNNVVMVTGSGFTALTELTARTAPNIDVGGIVAGEIPQCGYRSCVWGPMGVNGPCAPGTYVANDPLPASTQVGPPNGTDPFGGVSVVPVEGIVYAINNAKLMRCTTRAPGGGPNAIGNGAATAAPPAGMNCAAIMEGVEDLQFKYDFIRLKDDGTSSSSCSYDDPLSVIVPAFATCGSTKRGTATAGNDAVRFVAVNVGVVVRSLQQDITSFRGKGLRPDLFDRPAAVPVDSFRRARTFWRVMVPNVLVF